MDILIFIYNIFLIVLYTVVVTSSILNYSHKKMTAVRSDSRPISLLHI